MNRRFITVILSCMLFVQVLCGTTVNVNAEADKSIGYIYIGDSRFVGLNEHTKVSQYANKFVVAEGGMGYDWLVNTAEQQINEIEQSHPEITRWLEIYNLGVNDLGNIESYKSYISNRMIDHDVYYVSCNPVEDYWYVNNEQIQDFNNNIQTTGVKYIDLFTPLINMNVTLTTDQVHYNRKTNWIILKTIDRLVLSDVWDTSL